MDLDMVLGVDAGATKTEAIAADKEGHFVGRGLRGSGNYHQVGLEAAVKAVVEAAYEATGGRTAAGAVFGLAGVDLPEDRRVLESALQKAYKGSFVLENDTDIALRAGVEGPWGAVLISGTGTNASLLGPDGRWHRLRAMSYETGTAGGSIEMTREVLHRAFQAEEGTGPSTRLRDLVLETLGDPDFDAVATRYRGGPQLHKALLATAGSIAPLAFRAAEAGDGPAMDLLVEEGEAAGRLVAGLLRKAGLSGRVVPVVLAGGLFHNETPLFVDAVRLAVHRGAPLARVGVLKAPPVLGALLQAAGVAPSEGRAFRKTFGESSGFPFEPAVEAAPIP